MKTSLFCAAVLSIALVQGSRGEFGKPSASAEIDRILERAWAERGIQGNVPASDEVLLRRLYLDIAGRIPTREETAQFLLDENPDKRSALIDRLLQSEGYVSHFYHFWADILRLHSNINGGNVIFPLYSKWIKDSLRENKPYDQLVREMITAEGTPSDTGAIGYTVRDRGMPLDHMGNTVRIFLGTRLECAQCHNHPFDKWKQLDFFEMAAFSYGMGANNSKNTFSEVNRLISKSEEFSKERKRELNRALQEIRRPLRDAYFVGYQDRLPQLPRDYQYPDAEPKQKIEPAPIFGTTREISEPSDRLAVYAEWMTSPENPRFTKVIANRLWKQCMGVGLIEPVDELMDDTVASIPELMDFLEKQMRALDYDMKAFLGMIYHTRAYQATASTAELAAGDPCYFPGPLLRRMRAEQIWDSLVTLVNPTPDLEDWKRQQENELKMAVSRVYLEALDGGTGADLVRAAERVAEMQGVQRKRLEDLEQEIRAAREEGDKEKAKGLSRQVGQIRSQLNKGIQNMIYGPLMRERENDMIKVSFPGEGGSMLMKLSMMDAQGRLTQEFRERQKEAENGMMELEMRELGITDEKEQRSFRQFRSGIANRYLRAANLQSPAPRGHFLREFGQSDREIIENANPVASVPQALALLNGETFASLSHPHSVLARAVRAAEGPSAKIDAVYLSMLARLPSAEERSALLAEVERLGEPAYGDAVFAILNGQEFIFVQ